MNFQVFVRRRISLLSGKPLASQERACFVEVFKILEYLVCYIWRRLFIIIICTVFLFYALNLHVYFLLYMYFLWNKVSFRDESIVFVRAYVRACARARAPVS
jgi:hypothetical protein